MLTKLFLSHPRSVNESYVEHAAFAGRFALKLLAASAAAFVHAVLPFCFEKTASRMTAELYQKTHKRGAPAAAARPVPSSSAGRPQTSGSG